MLEYQPVLSSLIWAVERPRCPNCRHDRILLSKFKASLHRFECQNCGHVEIMVVESDPMTSGALGWLAGELKPPT
ncbi:MAG: response regulator [Bradyrhizobium sp.]